MKAKEYLQKFEEDSLKVDDNWATFNLMEGFLSEVKELIDKRKAQSGSSIISILKELNQKWNALCRMDKKTRFKKDGFIEIVKHRCAEKYPFLAIEMGKMEW